MALVVKANAAGRALGANQAFALQWRADVMSIVRRNVSEVAWPGRTKWADHVPRGILEFCADPASRCHKWFFAEDQTIESYCASGWRSVLGAKTGQNMGLQHLTHLKGGLSGWIEAKGPTDPPAETRGAK